MFSTKDVKQELPRWKKNTLAILDRIEPMFERYVFLRKKWFNDGLSEKEDLEQKELERYRIIDNEEKRSLSCFFRSAKFYDEFSSDSGARDFVHFSTTILMQSEEFMNGFYFSQKKLNQNPVAILRNVCNVLPDNNYHFQYHVETGEGFSQPKNWSSTEFNEDFFFNKLEQLNKEFLEFISEKLIVQVANHDSKIGHARIGFLYKDGSARWYGFSLNDESDFALFSGHGLVSEETTVYTHYINKNFDISPEQYYKAMDFIQEKIDKKDNYYNANYSNCISFVDCVLDVAEIPAKVADIFSNNELEGAGIGHKFIEYLRTPDLEGINIKKAACKEDLLDEQVCRDVIGNSMRIFK